MNLLATICQPEYISSINDQLCSDGAKCGTACTSSIFVICDMLMMHDDFDHHVVAYHDSLHTKPDLKRLDAVAKCELNC